MMITSEGYGVFAVSAVSAQCTDWWCLKWYRGPEDDDADGVHGVNAGVGHACISDGYAKAGNIGAGLGNVRWGSDYLLKTFRPDTTTNKGHLIVYQVLPLAICLPCSCCSSLLLWICAQICP